MAKRPPKISIGELRAFRSHVSALKKKGLVSSRVDARKQKPTRYMQNKVRILAPVLHNEAVGVKVKPDLLKQYKEAGFQVFGGRVIVEKTPEEISRTRKGLPLMRRHLGGSFVQERLVLPYGPTNIDDFRARVVTDPTSFDSLKEPGDAFAFKIYGNNSLATFADMQSLLTYLEHYQVIHERQDAWTSLQFFRVAPGSWKPTRKERRSASQQDRRDAGRVQWSRVKGQRLHRAEDAERKRQKRATDLSWAAKERERDRLRKAAKRSADPESNKAARLKEALRKRDLRRQAKADERNGR